MNQVIKLRLPMLLQLRIQLQSVEPAVWRQVLVPESITLPKLHQVIQAPMGWLDSTLIKAIFNTVAAY